jgi:hypothetical protein
MYHKEAFLNVLLKWGPLAMAELKLDTEGQYIGAVRVVVDGNVRASVAHGLSEPFRNLVLQLNREGRRATCRVELERNGEWVDLWLPSRLTPVDDTSPFLSAFGAATVRFKSGQAERLDDSLRSKAKSKRVKRLAHLERDTGLW